MRNEVRTLKDRLFLKDELSKFMCRNSRMGPSAKDQEIRGLKAANSPRLAVTKRWRSSVPHF